MYKFLNLIITFVLLLSTQTTVLAETISKTIFQSGINKDSVSVSVKDVETGKEVYSLNSKSPTMPASTLKLVTIAASLDTLGLDYEFKTQLFKNSDNELFLKLGADPFLTSSNLNKIFETAVKDKNIINPQNIYIDNYIFDDVEWGEGWQWDDDLNVLMPKFSAFNLDKNLLNIIITPTNEDAPAEIYTSKFYPVTFMNLVTTGKNEKITLNRYNNISPDTITISGTVNKLTTKKIPISNPKRYFILRVEDAISESKMDYFEDIAPKKTPNNAVIVSAIKHPISMAIAEILKNSNNLVAETVFKIAGAEFSDSTGSLLNSQKMLEEYLNKQGLNCDCIKIVDGSGVSKNNIITADFMTSFLVKESKNKIFIENLPTAGEGTLKNRMLYFENNLRAKTGTLSDLSSIAGYITAKSGKRYAFDIIINHPKSKESQKKSLEEYILRDIYTKF